MPGLLKPVPGAIINGFLGDTGSAGYLSSDGFRAADVPFSGATEKAHIHRALDISCPVGTPVRAPERMRIGWVARDEPDSYELRGYDRGLYVRAYIRQGTVMDFLHLSRLIALPGEVVERGEVFALSGASGHVTGPHLHWALEHTGSSSTAEFRNAHDWKYVYNPEMVLVGGSHASEPWLLPA